MSALYIAHILPPKSQKPALYIHSIYVFLLFMPYRHIPVIMPPPLFHRTPPTMPTARATAPPPPPDLILAYCHRHSPPPPRHTSPLRTAQHSTTALVTIPSHLSLSLLYTQGWGGGWVCFCTSAHQECFGRGLVGGRIWFCVIYCRVTHLV
jgi:hypothetical protein